MIFLSRREGCVYNHLAGKRGSRVLKPGRLDVKRMLLLLFVSLLLQSKSEDPVKTFVACRA